MQQAKCGGFKVVSVFESFDWVWSQLVWSDVPDQVICSYQSDLACVWLDKIPLVYLDLCMKQFMFVLFLYVSDNRSLGQTLLT